MKILVVAPHPDDELIAVGGTIAKRAKQGDDVYVCIVTKGLEPDFDSKMIEQGRAEDVQANRLLGTKEVIFLNLPANGLKAMKSSAVNDVLAEAISRFSVEELYIPFNGDVHIDHTEVALSCMVAARPKNGCTVRRIYSYEVPSETGWSHSRVGNCFMPNVYEDISESIGKKLEALRVMKSQIQERNQARSVECLEALAKFRGATVGVDYAEAFMLEREIK